MARPIDPTSRLQVEQRAKRLRSEESGWTRSLCLGVAMAALKAWQWAHYLENGGDPGPLAGTFPKLPEDPGTWVVVGAVEAPKEPEYLEDAPPSLRRTSLSGVRKASFVALQEFEEANPEVKTNKKFQEIRQQLLDRRGPDRLLLKVGDRWFVDGQAGNCEVPDVQQQALAKELAEVLQQEHLKNFLRPSFYQEVAGWIGELLKQPRPLLDELKTDLESQDRFWKDPDTGTLLGIELVVDGRTVLLTPEPGVSWSGDLWKVPKEPWGIPSDETLKALDKAGLSASAEEIAMSAAAWHFGKVLYRKVLDPRTINGQSGLERLALLRQLLEELEVVASRGLAVNPLEEGSVVRMTTHKTAQVASKAFCRSDLWIAEEGRGLYREAKDRKEFWEMSLASPKEYELAYLPLAECRRLLDSKNNGLEIAALHGVLRMCVMQLEDPRAEFTVSGDFLIEALGLKDRRGGGQTRSDLLKKVYFWSKSLGLARCTGWSKPRGCESFHVKEGLLWIIDLDTHCGVNQLNLLDEESSQEFVLTDFSITVKAGSWAETQRTQKGDHLLYVPIATEILRLGRQRGEMSFRLGVYLGTEYRIRPDWWATGKANIRVGDLLREVLPEPQLTKAKQNRDEARKLRERWGRALTILRDAVGFSFSFPGCHPALIPSGFAGQKPGAPNGALELLLNSRVEILWPEKVTGRRLKPSVEEVAKLQIRQERARLLNPGPDIRAERAARLKDAISTTGESLEFLGGRLGVSKGQLSKLQNNQARMTELELQDFLRKLKKIVRPRPRS